MWNRGQSDRGKKSREVQNEINLIEASAVQENLVLISFGFIQAVSQEVGANSSLIKAYGEILSSLRSCTLGPKQLGYKN